MIIIILHLHQCINGGISIELTYRHVNFFFIFSTYIRIQKYWKIQYHLIGKNVWISNWAHKRDEAPVPLDGIQLHITDCQVVHRTIFLLLAPLCVCLVDCVIIVMLFGKFVASSSNVCLCATDALLSIRCRSPVNVRAKWIPFEIVCLTSTACYASNRSNLSFREVLYSRYVFECKFSEVQKRTVINVL